MLLISLVGEGKCTVGVIKKKQINSPGLRCQLPLEGERGLERETGVSWGCAEGGECLSLRGSGLCAPVFRCYCGTLPRVGGSHELITRTNLYFCISAPVVTAEDGSESPHGMYHLGQRVSVGTSLSTGIGTLGKG